MDNPGSARQLTQGRQDGITYMDWTKDGRIIYAAPDSYQTLQLWITAANGSGPQQLTEGPYNACPSVCGDSHLVFQSFRPGSHIWRSNLDGGGARQLTGGDVEFQPACSPDGTWLTYYTALGVWRMPIDGGKPVRIWEHPGLTQISPNGKWVLIREGQAKSIIIPASGGQPVKTLDPDPELGLPLIWTADSRALLYVRTINGVSNVWQRSLEGGETKQLTNFNSDEIDTTLRGVALSRDGKKLEPVYTGDGTGLEYLPEYTIMGTTDEMKRIVFRVPCPNCCQKAPLILSEYDFQEAVTRGELHCYHVECRHDWAVKLDTTMKARLQALIEVEFPKD